MCTYKVRERIKHYLLSQQVILWQETGPGNLLALLVSLILLLPLASAFSPAKVSTLLLLLLFFLSGSWFHNGKVVAAVASLESSGEKQLDDRNAPFL